MANEEQIERWNGATAQRWITERERHAAVRRGLIPHLLRAADVRPGDRVLDVGCGCGDTTQMRDRLAALDEHRARRALAAMADQFAEHRDDSGIWVTAASHLVTAATGV